MPAAYLKTSVDIAAETDGSRRAVVKEFGGIVADKLLNIEFAGPTGPLDSGRAPIISGLEIDLEK